VIMCCLIMRHVYHWASSLFYSYSRFEGLSLSDGVVFLQSMEETRVGVHIEQIPFESRGALFSNQ